MGINQDQAGGGVPEQDMAILSVSNRQSNTKFSRVN
jgi:hypothetical protein